MLKQLLSFSLLVFFSFQCKAQEEAAEPIMDWEKYDPPSTLVVPEHDVKSAKYPFIDVHNHQFSMPTQDLNELVAEMDKLNMAVMVNLSGRGRGSEEHLKGALDNVNKTAANRFIVFTNIDVSNINEKDWTERPLCR